MLPLPFGPDSKFKVCFTEDCNLRNNFGPPSSVKPGVFE